MNMKCAPPSFSSKIARLRPFTARCGDSERAGGVDVRPVKPLFPPRHGLPRVGDRRVVSGIIYAIRHGLQWKNAPRGFGPHKTLYNRFIRWSRRGGFARIFAALAAEREIPEW